MKPVPVTQLCLSENVVEMLIELSRAYNQDVNYVVGMLIRSDYDRLQQELLSEEEIEAFNNSSYEDLG